MLTTTQGRRTSGAADAHLWAETHWDHLTAVVRREFRRRNDGGSYDPDDVHDALAICWSGAHRFARDDGRFGRDAYATADAAVSAVRRGQTLTRTIGYVDACHPLDWQSRLRIDEARTAAAETAHAKALALEALGFSQPIGVRIQTVCRLPGMDAPIDVYLMPDR